MVAHVSLVAQLSRAREVMPGNADQSDITAQFFMIKYATVEDQNIAGYLLLVMIQCGTRIRDFVTSTQSSHIRQADELTTQQHRHEQQQ